MEDLFGKDDSGNDSDAVDIDDKDEKDNDFDTHQPGRKDSSDGMDIDGAAQAIKVPYIP